MRISRRMMAAALAAFMGCAGPALAQVEYKIPGIVDNSGPFADLTKHLIARDAVFKWWNDNEGKKLGIRRDYRQLKHYKRRKRWLG